MANFICQNDSLQHLCIYIVKPKARLEHGTGGAVGVGGGGSSRLVHLLWNSKKAFGALVAPVVGHCDLHST